MTRLLGLTWNARRPFRTTVRHLRPFPAMAQANESGCSYVKDFGLPSVRNECLGTFEPCDSAIFEHAPKAEVHNAEALDHMTWESERQKTYLYPGQVAVPEDTRAARPTRFVKLSFICK